MVKIVTGDVQTFMPFSFHFLPPQRCFPNGDLGRMRMRRRRHRHLEQR